jgi:hypothetical protein
MASRKIAEAAEATEIELGYVVFVANLREMRGNPIHVATKCSTPKSPKYAWILEVLLQHGAFPFARGPGTPWPQGEL